MVINDREFARKLKETHAQKNRFVGSWNVSWFVWKFDWRKVRTQETERQKKPNNDGRQGVRSKNRVNWQ